MLLLCAKADATLAEQLGCSPDSIVDPQRWTTRATFIVKNVGVVPAVLGEGMGRSIDVYQKQFAELT